MRSKKVPAMFAPLAAATLDVITLDHDDVILDVACGTGIVARTLRERLGPQARIIGADLNEGMITTARSLTDAVSKSCEWHIAPVNELPFGDQEFTVVICQQGFQFFPDERGALTEMQRVLRGGGQAVISIWKEPSPFFQAVGTSISKHVGDAAATRAMAPFTYTGHATFKDLMLSAGFANFSVRELTVDRFIGKPDTAIELEIIAGPAATAVKECGPEVMRTIVQEVTDALPQFIKDGALVVPQLTCLYQARST